MSEIDTARLADWMDNAGVAGTGEPLHARFLSGGTQNVIYEIRRGEHTCVLRMPPAGAPPDRDKGILREWRIIEALAALGVPCTFEGRNDLAIDGKKISGNAQFVLKDRVLHHGTLLFSAAMADLSGALRVDPVKYRDKAV